MSDTADQGNVENKANEGRDKKVERSFNVNNIYIKDASFEAPNTPDIFALHWEPKLDFNLSVDSKKIHEEVWESILNVTVKVEIKVAEDKRKEYGGKETAIAFIVEVKLGGIFSIVGFKQEEIDVILAVETPEILFPYIRETISNLVSKGGFPVLFLPPMNFDAMYKRHLEDKKKEGKDKDKGDNVQSPVNLN